MCAVAVRRQAILDSSTACSISGDDVAAERAIAIIDQPLLKAITTVNMNALRYCGIPMVFHANNNTYNLLIKSVISAQSIALLLIAFPLFSPADYVHQRSPCSRSSRSHRWRSSRSRSLRASSFCLHHRIKGQS